ncbi:MAG: HAD-IA family hydrolase, partial [Ornithinimicrobium sp.]
LSTGQSLVPVVVDGDGRPELTALRASGWPVTGTSANGVRGPVAVLMVTVDDKALSRLPRDIDNHLTPPLWRVHRAIGVGGDKLVAVVTDDEVEGRVGDEVRAAWEQEYSHILDEVVLLDGARAPVLALHERGLRAALASSGKKRFTDHVIELLDLPDGVLSTVTTSEDAEQSKPSPDILDVALRQAGGRGAVVVGDTSYDVASAARMGAPRVVVRSGGFGVQELPDAGAVLIGGSYSVIYRRHHPSRRRCLREVRPIPHPLWWGVRWCRRPCARWPARKAGIDIGAGTLSEPRVAARNTNSGHSESRSPALSVA